MGVWVRLSTSGNMLPVRSQDERVGLMGVGSKLPIVRTLTMLANHRTSKKPRNWIDTMETTQIVIIEQFYTRN